MRDWNTINDCPYILQPELEHRQTFAKNLEPNELVMKMSDVVKLVEMIYITENLKK